MKDIKGFEGLYAVTKTGKIWSYEKKWYCGKPKILFIKKAHWIKGYVNKFGYRTGHLKKNKKNFDILFHRIVAKTFISNPKNLSCINHKDCNPSNNNVKNLEWCTYKYNSEYMVNLKRNHRGEEHHASKLTDKKVIKIRYLYSTKKFSLNALAHRFSVSKRIMLNVIHKTIWTHI